MKRSGTRKCSASQGAFTFLSGQAGSVQGEVSQVHAAAKGFAAAIQGTLKNSGLSVSAKFPRFFQLVLVLESFPITSTAPANEDF